MTRINLNDGQGWFNSDSAIKFSEGTWWDGHNNVSTATGDKFCHESLFRTASGRWVLEAWSQWGGHDSYTLIDDDTAVRWLLLAGEHAAAEKYGPAIVTALEV